MWIARDKNGELYAYNFKPVHCDDPDFFTCVKDIIELDPEEFKDVTYENSPREIKSCSSLVDQVKYYMDTTPKDQLDKEFKDLEKWDNVGPTVDEYLSGINWKEVRIQAAISTLQGLCSNPNAKTSSNNSITDKAVYYADKLIESLKK